MKNGMMAEVIEYNLSNDIKVKFDNGEIVKQDGKDLVQVV